jgi:putative salt-induced outer membrane protein YdiY
MRYALVLSVVCVCLVLIPSIAYAQQPDAPTPLYSGSLGGGLAFTNGNSDTKNFNLVFGVVRDPTTKNVVKLNALYLRGSQSDVLSLDRASVTLRDEYSLSKRTFVFGQGDYLRDQFKAIRYLVAPVAGIGYKLADSDATKFALSGGAGGIWEKNIGLPISKSGSVNAGQTFSQKLSSTAMFTQSIATIWKTNNFSDYLSTASAGLTTSIVKKLELKLEFLDSYKNRPATVAIKKNDTAFVTSFVVKF